MESRVNAWVQWSASEVKELVDDEDSCVYFEKMKRHIALQPLHLNNLNKALHEILSKSIYQYDPELKGLLLSYKNPKLLSSLGSILYDSYFIHVDIEADFYVFRPEIGCTLNGIVNKQAANHIGVLVHKAFHVSIPINEDDYAWKGHDVYVGQDVRFTVTELDFKGKLPFIRGKLLSDSTPADDNEDSQQDAMTSNYDHEVVNHEENDEEDDAADKHAPPKPLKPSKRINFMTSLTNQSSGSSSEGEEEPVRKSIKQKHKTPVENVKESKKKKVRAIERDEHVVSPPKDKNSNAQIENDCGFPEHKVKKKSKSRKKPQNEHENKNENDGESNAQEGNGSRNIEANGAVSPVLLANHDRKPRIIHDHMINGNEHKMKIEKNLTKSQKKKSIFAHDISDSNDDSDDDRRVLTQSTYSMVSNKQERNRNEKYSDEPSILNAAEADGESGEESEVFNKRSITNDKVKIKASDECVDSKEYLSNSEIVRTSTPMRTTKLDKNSQKSKTVVPIVNIHAGVKCNLKDDHSDDSSDISNIDDKHKMKKKLKKKLKKIIPAESQESSTEYPPHSMKVKNERAVTSPKKSRASHGISSASEDESFDFKSPKEIKMRKNETNSFVNVKIKHEPNTSDVESPSNNKSDRQLKGYTMNDTDSFDQTWVKSEPVKVKTEVKHRSEMKRKHKEENENNMGVKCETNSFDSDTSFLPRKKIKTIFSE